MYPMALTTSRALGSLLRSTVRYSTPRESRARKVALHWTQAGFVYTVIMRGIRPSGLFRRPGGIRHAKPPDH